MLLFFSEFEAASLVDQLSMSGVRVIIYNLDELTDVTDTLLNVYLHIIPSKSQLNFVVLCADQCIRQLFMQVSERYSTHIVYYYRTVYRLSTFKYICSDHAPTSCSKYVQRMFLQVLKGHCRFQHEHPLSES